MSKIEGLRQRIEGLRQRAVALSKWYDNLSDKRIYEGFLLDTFILCDHVE